MAVYYYKVMGNILKIIITINKNKVAYKWYTESQTKIVILFSSYIYLCFYGTAKSPSPAQKLKSPMDPPPTSFPGGGRLSRTNSGNPASYASSVSPAPRNASTWDSLPIWWPSGFREASDISGRRVSEMTNFPAADNFCASGMIVPRKASVWDAMSCTGTHVSVTHIAGRTATWNASRASSTHISACASTMAKSRSRVSETKITNPKATDFHDHRPQWDALVAGRFARIFTANEGFTWWSSWMFETAAMTSGSCTTPPTLCLFKTQY